MTPSLKPSTQAKLRRFAELFPEFYEQFVSSDIQFDNLKLAYQLYTQKTEAIITADPAGDKTALRLAAKNQPGLLRDLFGVLAAYNLTAHSLNVYGQVQSPTLIFIRMNVSRGGKAIAGKTADNVRRALREALEGRFEVEEMLSVEVFESNRLGSVQTEFYIDKQFHLPALLIESDEEDGMFFKMTNAICPEKLLVVNANLLPWRGRTRLILYVLTEQGKAIPEYRGQKMAERVKARLNGSST
ncbi:MAG: hypothetical protein HC824_07255 [Synechococcales cyanobacterium RM1_1_8]|nr:hypothetical protein [Synechococcales cyanobacterium RM1_1_8]